MDNTPTIPPANEPRVLSEAEVTGYLRLTRKSSYAMGCGVMLIVCSPIALIVCYILAANGLWMTENFATMVGLIALFVLIGLAAGIFIYNSVKLYKYEYIKTDLFLLETAVLDYVRAQAEENQVKTTKSLFAGIALCIVSLIPVLAAEILYKTDVFKIAVSIGLLFFIAGIGLFIIVGAQWRANGYKVLLQEGAHTRAKESIDRSMLKKISLIFWPLMLAAYLLWSFLSGAWGITWILWPSAGALYYVIFSICISFLSYKK